MLPEEAVTALRLPVRKRFFRKRSKYYAVEAVGMALLATTAFFAIRIIGTVF